jgi:phosphohistidine phosphatase
MMPEHRETDRIRQASVIPLRGRSRMEDAVIPESSCTATEVCLITSIRRGKWGVPKGIIDPGETAEETALKEAAEEAGLEGELLGPAVGSYRYRKWGAILEVAVFAMHVVSAADDWEEADCRERLWLPVEKAAELISREELRELLPMAVDRWQSRGAGSS